MDFSNRDKNSVLLVYRGPFFCRSLDDLRNKGGTAAAAARKADDFINNLIQKRNNCVREKFRLTRNSEYRIKNCIKIDLVGGYRLVCIKKDCHLVLLYVGSHDDCFRWIERNKGLTCEIDYTIQAIHVSKDSNQEEDHLPQDVLEEIKFVEQHEEALMRQINDDVLSSIFSGWCKGRSLHEELCARKTSS